MSEQEVRIHCNQRAPAASGDPCTCGAPLPPANVTFNLRGQRVCERCWWADVERTTGHRHAILDAQQLALPLEASA